MENLPDDIVIAVATQLRRESSTKADLVSFIKVSRSWNALGVPLLYGNIGLMTKSIEPFTNGFDPSRYGRYVRSLSLRVGALRSLIDSQPFTPPNEYLSWGFPTPPLGETEVDQREPEIANETWATGQSWPTNERSEGPVTHFASIFARYVPILREMQNLVSFSLVIEGGALWCRLPRATIAGLIDALPPACTNLELDTQGNDQSHENDQTHICDSIARVIPQLHNLRIRLSVLCSAILSPESDSNSSATVESSETSSSTTPLTLPCIRSLVINCRLASFDSMLQCGYEGDKRYTIGAEAWCAIISSLTDLVRQNAQSLKNAKIFVLSPTWGDPYGITIDTLLRTDMVNQTTWAFPCIQQIIDPSRTEHVLVRSADGCEEVVKNIEHADPISEGHLWRDVVGGGRLPAHVLEAESKGLPSFATGCVQKSAPDLMDEWLSVHPDEPRSITIRNEKSTGLKLVFAEERIGDDYLALRPIEEVTPEGWKRVNVSLQLEPA